MIFPTDRLIKLRGDLEDRVSAGELSEADAYREALAADPQDPRALRLLALLAEEEGDFDTAGRLAWRWLHADPLSHEGIRLIARLLGRDPAQAARAAAYQALGNQKLHFDPEAGAIPAEPVPAGEEPPEVTHELEPHRLLHTIWTASTGEVEAETLDRVLARGADMQPLLTGILNLYGEDLLDDVDDALVVRSLALLGEIGDPQAVPALARFLALDDDVFSMASGWAVQRIALRRRAEALSRLNLLIPGAEAFDLAAFAQQVCLMPVTEGRADSLLAIAGRVKEFDKIERAALVVSLIAGAYVMEGMDSALAATFLRDYGDHLDGKARRELEEVREQLKGEVPYVAEEADATVHSICCPAFDAAEEDIPYVRNEPKLGRNDPCWCGSGKKYKKCHLPADDGR